MAYVTLNVKKLKQNYDALSKMFADNDLEWGVVTKLLCGNAEYIDEVAKLGIDEMLDSRISNLKIIKDMNPEINTVYIKPPSWEIIEELVKFADVSFNTELETIKLISNEAVRQNKKHKIVIMIELGDLREGVMREELYEFYSSVFRLPNIEVIGIGANLHCLNGVLPNADKLIQLSLYKNILELQNNVKIPWISAGTTVTLSLLCLGQLPVGINHFRIGEALFFGRDIVSGQMFEGMCDDVLELHSQVIELSEKPMLTTDDIVQKLKESDESIEIAHVDVGYRALLDIGRLDIEPENLILDDADLGVLNASSDVLVIDAGNNVKGIKVGDFVKFKLSYMGALRLMNSDYIEKKVCQSTTQAHLKEVTG